MKSILFDSEEQEASTAVDNIAVPSVPVFRSTDYKFISNGFIGSMMVQYILIFFAIPFSEVDNRPTASVFSCLFGYLSFLLCVVMIPAELVNVPTSLSLRCSMTSAVLKLLDLAANTYSVVACLNGSAPMIEYTYDSGILPTHSLDITLYLRVISCLLLSSASISLLFAIIVVAYNYSYISARTSYENTLIRDEKCLSGT